MASKSDMYFGLLSLLYLPCTQGTDMLGRFLHVQHPTAKQAVITAIDLLGIFLYKKAACLFLFLESCLEFSSEMYSVPLL